MRTTTLILSVTTAAFAASTGWLAWQLQQRDAPGEVRAPSPAAPMSEPQQSGTQFVASSPGPAAAGLGPPAGQSAAIVDAADPTVDADAPAGKRNLAQDPTVMFAHQFLARYDDSAQRQTQLEEARTGIRRQYGQLKEQLGLSDEKFEQIVDVLAQQNLQGQERWARCAVDPDCDPGRPRPGAVDDRSQELLALLGPDHIDDFNRYRSSLGERDSVAAFRGRLADSQFLPQARAEQLIEALSQERELYTREVQQSGSTVRGLGTSLGMVWYSDAAGTPEAQLAEALQYSQRMRARAATLLTPAQLAAFVQMQEELLAQMANVLRPPPRKADALKLARG